MQKRSIVRLSLLLALCLTNLVAAQATTFMEWQCTYLGDGWFRYRMTVMNDPFFTQASIPGMQISFPGEIDQSGGSTNWYYAGSTDSTSSWASTNGFQPRPYTETFLMRSSETSYRLAAGTNFDGAMVLMSLYLAEFYPGMESGGFSANIVGYAKIPCLVPCRPEDADGSPTNFVYHLKLVPDVNITRLVQENGIIDGVDFNYGYPSTFLLQGTLDLVNWTNIAYLWSQPPETVWTTNRSLGDYGQFFRLAIVAGDQTTNLPPLGTAGKMTSKKSLKANHVSAQPQVTGCQISHGKLAVTLAAQSGQPVLVEAINAQGTVFESQQVLPDGSSATAAFDPARLPNPVFFQAISVR